MSPLGSKEPNEPFLSPHTVFVSSRPQKSAYSVYAPPRQWRLWKLPCADAFWQTERKNSLSSSSCRIADQEPWMSLLLSRPSPVWVIDPRSVRSPVEFSVGTTPRNPASWRTFLISRQSPMRATSWLATIQPIPGMRHQVLYTLGQFRIALTEAADLSGRLHRLASQKTPNCQATDRA